jgi:hypothetical protein
MVDSTLSDLALAAKHYSTNFNSGNASIINGTIINSTIENPR